MKTVEDGLNAADEDSRRTFFQTIFDKMHLELKNIRAENFGRAEGNLDLIKALLDYQGAAEQFVSSPDFYSSGMNGL